MKYRITLHQNEQHLLAPGDPQVGVLILEEKELIAREVHAKTSFVDPEGKSRPFYTNSETQTNHIIGTAENLRTQIYGARQ